MPKDYSQLSREELLELVVKQEADLSFKLFINLVTLNTHGYGDTGF
jgi:hypothetical protein